MKQLTIAGLLWVLVSAACTAWAAEPLPLTVSPVSGTEVTSGRSFTLRVDTDAPIESMDVEVSARWQPQKKRGSPPMEFTVEVPWDEAGPYSVGVYVQSFDPATSTLWYGEEELELFAMPDPSEVPTELRFGMDSLRIQAPVSGEVGETERVVPAAVHGALGSRVVDLGRYGTNYTSSDPSIATVNADGWVTAVSPGTAFVAVDYLGVQGLVEVSVEDPSTGRVPIVEYTDQVILNASGFRRDPEKDLFVQEVSFTNQTEWPIPQPIHLVVEGLPEGIEMPEAPNKTRKTEPLGSPMVSVKSEGSFLLPGETATNTLKFRNLDNLPITYNLRLFGAAFP